MESSCSLSVLKYLEAQWPEGLSIGGVELFVPLPLCTVPKTTPGWDHGWPDVQTVLLAPCSEVLLRHSGTA